MKMKTKMTTSVLIALVAVIGLVMAGCNNSTGGDPTEPGGTDPNPTDSGAPELGLTVNLTKSVSTEFGAMVFTKVWDNIVSGGSSPIADCIDGSPEVKVTSGGAGGFTLTIKLGAPKSAKLSAADGLITWVKTWGSGLSNDTATVSDAIAKVFYPTFCDDDEEYFVTYDIDYEHGYKSAQLIYADKDVNISGSFKHSSPDREYIFNAELKAGWNYIIGTRNDTAKTYTFTATRSAIDGFGWVVYED